MQVQITDAGVALLQSNEGPVALTVAKFGAGVNYTPEPTDTNIHGAVVFTTIPTSPVVVSANVYRYSVIVDLSAPSFDFGEVGLFTDNGTLFALCVSTELIHKLQMSGGDFGNTVRLDAYLSIVGQNYDMWMDSAESNNQFRMAVIGSVDQLPLPQNATPNAYIVQGSDNFQAAFIAYTDRAGLWNFDAYAYANKATGTIVSADSQSVTIPQSQFVDTMNPNYFGEIILEFTSGALYGICRYVKTAVISGGNVTLGFNTPLLITPKANDTFVTLKRQDALADVPIPIATTTKLGGIIVGPSLVVAIDGTLNVGPITFPVTSVNNKTGDVHLTAADIPGFATVATSGSYNDLTDKPAAYVLPAASLTALGGVKAPPSGNLTISASGVIDLGSTLVSSVNGMTGAVVLDIPPAYTLPIASASVLGGVRQGTGITIASNGILSAAVRSVSGQTGDVIIKAQDNNNATGTSLIIGDGSGTGVIRLKTIVAGAGITLSSDVNGNMQITGTGSYLLPVATTTVLGGIKQGTGVTIAGDGTLSVTSSYTLPVATTTVLGGVKQGANVSIAGDGTLNVAAPYTLPVASTTVLGGVKQGTGVTIAGDGTLSVTASGYTLPVATTTVLGGVKQGTGVSIAGDGTLSVTAIGGVSSVSGQTGAVVVKASDNNATSGVSLISDNGATTGIIKLKTIVAGTGITLSADANGNLQIDSSASGGGVTSFNTRAGAVTLSSADITSASGALQSDVAASKYYDVSGGAGGAIISGQILCLQPAVRQITFQPNFAGSVGFAGTAPTLSFTIQVTANGTTIGTIVFAAGSQSATFTTTGGVQQVVSAGSHIMMTAPGTADATIANVAATLLGLAT